MGSNKKKQKNFWDSYSKNFFANEKEWRRFVDEEQKRIDEQKKRLEKLALKIAEKLEKVRQERLSQIPDGLDYVPVCPTCDESDVEIDHCEIGFPHSFYCWTCERYF